MTQPANLPQASNPDDDLIDLKDLVRTIWRGKIIIFFVTALAVLLAIYFAFAIAVPLYRSSAVVILETQQNSVIDIQSVVGGMSGDTSAVNSEVEVLRARSLMGKVVDRLDLVNDPEFNKDMRPPSLKSFVGTQIRSLIFGTTTDEPANEETNTRVRNAAITDLLAHTTIRNIPLSLVFQITVETTNAQKSALIADTIVELYILNQLEVKFDATEQATSWLTDRVASLQLELESAEAAVSDFNATTDFVSIEALQAMERQLKETRDRVSTAEIAGEVAFNRLAAFQNADSREDKSRLANDSQLDRFLLRATTDAAMATAFDTRYTQIITRATLETDRAEQQMLALQNSENTLADQIRTQGQDLIELQQLMREAEANRLLYEYFLSRLKETSAQYGIQQADSRILSSAVIAENASSPRKPIIVAMAGILGILLGIIIVLFREARNNKYRTAQEIEQETGLTVFGQIPLIPAKNRKSLLQYFIEKPTSFAAEAIRNLRTSILLSNVDTPPKVIVSTSSIPGEGKTTNSLLLAQSFIGMGKKVLLVEGDVRRKTFSQYFQNIPRRGLVSLLAGEISLEQAIFQSDGFPADLLISETTTVNAADLFSSEKFKAVVAELRELYDIIIIDTPPVLIVPDARIIAQNADTVLISVKWDGTEKQLVEDTIRVFQASNQKIAGIVLTQISSKGMKRYGYGGKYGSYAKYGAKYYSN